MKTDILITQLNQVFREWTDFSYYNEADKRGHAGCNLPTVQIKDYNVMLK